MAVVTVGGGRRMTCCVSCDSEPVNLGSFTYTKPDGNNEAGRLGGDDGVGGNMVTSIRRAVLLLNSNVSAKLSDKGGQLLAWMLQ